MINITDFILPAIVTIIVIFGAVKGINVFDTFLEGAKSGFKTVLGIAPPLIALIVVDHDALKAAGIKDDDVQGVIENSVFALNSKLPVYSQIARCELRREPFEKTPKLSIKRFMYN